jgi:hypothetical protein
LRRNKSIPPAKYQVIDSSITTLTESVDPYYLLTFILFVTDNTDSDRLKELLHAKITKRKRQIHPAHNSRFNHDMQLEIDCIEWALQKIEVNKLPNDRLEGVIKTMIKDLEKRKDKAMIRSETDDLWTKTETLQWVLYIIFAIRNGNMVMV